MKQKLLITCVLLISAMSSFAQDSLKQKISFYGFYANFSEYKLNSLLAAQNIPEVKLNRFGTGIGYEFEIKKWSVAGNFGYAKGKYKEDNITTKSNLMTGELQVGHSIYRKSNFNVFAGAAFLANQNTVSIVQEPKPTISLDNLLGANNNLTIKNENYYAGIFAKTNLFTRSEFSPYVSLGYYFPLAKTKWKADDTEIVNNVKENPFIFNVSLGFSLWDF